VSEVMGRRRRLNLSMIRKLHEQLEIPVECLVKDYKLVSFRQACVSGRTGPASLGCEVTMTARAIVDGRLGRVQKELTRWRERHGGRGRAIPQELWAAAVEAALVDGVHVTARALGLDRDRLSGRVAARSGAGGVEVPARPQTPASTTFVEVDAQQVFSRGRVLVRLTGRDGEQVEVTLEGAVAEVAALARAFWERSR